MKFSRREVATVLAALRYWQRNVLDAGKAPENVSSHFDKGAIPISSEGIDKLCEAINLDHQDDINARREKIEVALGDMARGETDEN